MQPGMTARKQTNEELKAERKRLRVIRNREAAQASRNKQKAYVKSLETANEILKSSNAALLQQKALLEKQNSILLAQLESISSILVAKSQVPFPITSLEAFSPSTANSVDLHSLQTPPSSLPPNSPAEVDFFSFDDSLYASPVASVEQTAGNIDLDPEMTIEDFFASEYLPTKPLAQSEASVFDPKLISEPEVLTSPKQMINSRGSLTSQSFLNCVPTMLLAFCSQLMDCKRSRRIMADEQRWNDMLKLKYPNCHHFLVHNKS